MLPHSRERLLSTCDHRQHRQLETILSRAARVRLATLRHLCSSDSRQNLYTPPERLSVCFPFDSPSAPAIYLHIQTSTFAVFCQGVSVNFLRGCAPTSFLLRHRCLKLPMCRSPPLSRSASQFFLLCLSGALVLRSPVSAYTVRWCDAVHP